MPTPHLDPTPDDHPGGVDGSVVDESVEEFPQLIPDTPISAQLDDDVVPDAIQEGDDKQQEGEKSDGDGADSESEPT